MRERDAKIAAQQQQQQALIQVTGQIALTLKQHCSKIIDIIWKFKILFHEKSTKCSCSLLGWTTVKFLSIIFNILI